MGWLSEANEGDTQVFYDQGHGRVIDWCQHALEDFDTDKLTVTVEVLEFTLRLMKQPVYSPFVSVVIDGSDTTALHTS